MSRQSRQNYSGRAGTSRRSVLKTTAAGVAAAAVSPFMFKIAQSASDPVRIGLPVPLSGPYGSEAREQGRCAQIAVDEFNTAGGLNGRMAELLVRDDKLNPGEAATRTQELIEKDKVQFVCGSLSASVQLAVNEVCKARGVIYMSISQSDQINEVRDFSKYTFHEAMNPHMTTGPVGRYVFPKHGKRIAFLIADYAFGHELTSGLKREGKQHGIEVVAEVKHPIAAKDFSAFLPQIQSAKPDVLFLCNFGYDQLNSIKQAIEFGFKNTMRLVVPVLLYTQRLVGGAAYDGVIGGTNYYWELEDSIPSAKAFNDTYRKLGNGSPPSDYGAYGYSGVGALLAATKAAGSTDADKVIAALESLKYDKYKGVQYFRKCDHQSVQSVYIIESKAQAEVKNTYDVFKVVHTEPAGEGILRTCSELGF